MAKKSDEAPATEKVEVTRGAIRLITQCLQQAGWAKQTSTLYQAGKLATELEERFEDDKMPDSAPEPVVKEWAHKTVEVELDKKQKKLMKACLSHHVGQGVVAPTQHFMCLAEVLDMDLD